jgi:hypothetical protein
LKFSWLLNAMKPVRKFSSSKWTEFQIFPTLSLRVINSFHVDTVGFVAFLVPAYACVTLISSYLFVGCDVFTALVMSSVFCDITPCSPFKIS